VIHNFHSFPQGFTERKKNQKRKNEGLLLQVHWSLQDSGQTMVCYRVAKVASQLSPVEIVVSRPADLDYGLCHRAELLPIEPVGCHALPTIDPLESQAQQ